MINRLSFVKVFNYWLRKMHEICNPTNNKTLSLMFIYYILYVLVTESLLESLNTNTKLHGVQLDPADGFTFVNLINQAINCFRGR